MSSDHSHAGHAHSEDHAHSHDHAPKDFGKAFALGIILQVAFVFAEIGIGLAAHSLAVLADAGHNVSDVLALGLAWGATVLGRRGASKGRTYGLRSASILVAVANALCLVFVSGAIAWEAIGRIRHPEPVAAVPVILISLVGVCVNGFCAWLFAKGQEDINIRAAFLHLVSDAAVAAGVAATGVVIRLTSVFWLDPVASLGVAAVVLVSTWSLLRRAIDLAMHAVPKGIDEERVRAWFAALPGVVSVHDLHIWAMSTTENALTAHISVEIMPSDALACDIDAKVRHEFPVHHVTIQIDPGESGCALATAGAI